MEERSVHDNRVLRYEVDASQRRLVFDTVYEDGGADERTTITFSEVVAYGVTGDDFRTILFGLEECDPADILERHRDLFERGRQYNWPGNWNRSDETALTHLRENGVRGFELDSSCGLDAWVLAKAVTVEPTPESRGGHPPGAG
jgi:hypothetical protein